MKSLSQSLAKILVLALSLTAVTAFGSETNSSTLPSRDGGIRFDVDCSFGSVGCSAQARIFKTWQDESATSIQPQWGGNLMAISCRGQLIYANDAGVFTTTDNDGYHWLIEGVNTYPLVALRDHPFDGSPNPKTVDSRLDFGNGHLSDGTCTIDRVRF